MRTILAVLAGFALWSILWVGGHQAAFALLPAHYDAEGIPETKGLYGLYLAFSVGCSLLAGRVARRLAPGNMAALAGLGMLLLLVGIGFQASVWSLEPLWYHLLFLALLVPATLLGGRARSA